MRIQRPVFDLLLTCIFASTIVPLSAQSASSGQGGSTVPTPTAQADNSEIRRHLKDGQKVVVIDDTGGKVQGRVVDRNADALTLSVGGERIGVRYDRIVRIDRPNDGIGNGALIGFGVGAGLGLAGALSAAGDDSGWGSPDPMEVAAIAPLVFGGIGAAIGAGVDAIIRREPTLYRRQGPPRVSVATAVGRSRRAVAISVSW